MRMRLFECLGGDERIADVHTRHGDYQVEMFFGHCRQCLADVRHAGDAGRGGEVEGHIFVI